MFQYTIIGSAEGEANVVAFIPGDPMPLAAHSSHPNYERIVSILQGAEDAIPDEDFRRLFDVAEAVSEKFQRLGERVTVQGGHVYFDGDEVHSTITSQIVRFLNDGVEDWKPLVRFMENVAANPSDHSRDMLFDWLAQGIEQDELTITADGMIVGYKGVSKDDEGNFVSVHSGRAIVNGEAITGYIPNPEGAVVEMPRSQVVHDPHSHCSRGLHVGTYRYAQSWGKRGAMLKVLVNPRDVVSVPNDARGEKVRVCRYKVAEVIDAPLASPVDADCAWDDDFDADWGDGDDYTY